MAQGLSNRSRSRVVVIGSSGFEYLHDLPAVENNANAIHNLLTDPTYWGVEHCKVVLNPANPQEVDTALAEAANEVEPGGMLLIYYSGHGIVGPDRNLYLALPGTKPDSPHATAVPYEWIKFRIGQNRATHRLVILDCCYSGRAQMGNIDQRSLAQRLGVQRSCLLLAASEDVEAQAPPDRPYTAFTTELVDLITHGLARGPALLDIRTVWQHLRQRLTNQGFPEPQLKSDNAGEDMPLVTNCHPGSRDRRGQILYAHPSVTDSDLRQAVIIILRHNPGGGTIGVVLNRPTGHSVRYAADDWHALCNRPRVVFDGGPVKHEGHIPLTLLLSNMRRPLGFRPIAGPLGTLNLAQRTENLKETITHLRLFSGFLGWGPGELELEIAQDVLIPTDKPATFAFHSARDMWQEIQRPRHGSQVDAG